jgi:hypothetical protein
MPKRTKSRAAKKNRKTPFFCARSKSVKKGLTGFLEKPPFFRLWKYFHSRKNALFYRTLHGAQVGDLFMSLIHTCQLCGVSSFDYLVELHRHVRELAACPTEWMPWNYRETLARTVNLPDPA